jgi:hypothetical protein
VTNSASLALVALLVTSDTETRRRGRAGASHFTSAGRDSIILSEGPYVSPARPSDKGGVKVEVTSSGLRRGRGISTSSAESGLRNLKRQFGSLQTKAPFLLIEIGRPAREARSSNLEPGNHLSICLGTGKPRQLCPDGRASEVHQNNNLAENTRSRNNYTRLTLLIVRIALNAQMHGVGRL